MYSIVRGDLEMPPGKLAAQSGHGFTDSLLACIAQDPAAVEAYRRDGSKVVLRARHLADLERAADMCRELGLPHALVTDSGHILLPHFDGSPVVTALGIGPCPKANARPVTRRFPCVR